MTASHHSEGGPRPGAAVRGCPWFQQAMLYGKDGSPSSQKESAR